jgi:hypothetical protein
MGHDLENRRIVNFSGSSNLNNSETLPGEIIGRLASLYPQLSPGSATSAAEGENLNAFGSPTLEMPTVDALSERLGQCSFKIFEEPPEYFQNPRAKEFVSWSAPRSDVYRIYFNTYSGKVYIDLNGKRWNEVCSKLQEELLYCDILRTLIFVLTCEVEMAEARKADESAAGNAVTGEVTEVIIP